MRIESAYENEVCFEVWETPVIHNEQLWLIAELRIQGDIHFFFHLNSNSPDIHVATISFRSPLRITDEDFADYCIEKYLKRKAPTKPSGKRPSTFKLWNTNFIKEIDENKALSDFAPERDKNIFQYLIVTQEEYIEFISEPPIWNFHQNMELEDAINFYMKQSLKRYEKD